MTVLGTPLSRSSTKAMLLGSGELGKEVAIELQRLGVEVIAIDRYANAPAMQVAHRNHVINMLDPVALRGVVEAERPDFIIPEIEAIATTELLKLEGEGFKVVPSARAANLTMNREGIRVLAANELGLPTSEFRFASDYEGYCSAVSEIGLPCVIKPIMSSSGKGQSIVKDASAIDVAWRYAQEGGRAGQGRVIIEAFVPFDYEITLLTVRHIDGVLFCEPIGHFQEDGDYRTSWQPHAMSASVLSKAQHIAEKVTGALGGYGLFGVECFVKGDEVYFSEVSPRPHDTGLVTLISQSQSEFAMHARALLGLPVTKPKLWGPSASAALLVEGCSAQVAFQGVDEALRLPEVDVRLFGKPEVNGKRRMGVTLARAETVEDAKSQALNALSKISVNL